MMHGTMEMLDLHGSSCGLSNLEADYLTSIVEIGRAISWEHVEPLIFNM